MIKAITFFTVMLVGCGILIGIQAGGGGVVTTYLSEDITAANTTIPVTTTTDFLEEDFVVIGNEKILYTGVTNTSFTGCTRGYDGSEAAAYEAGRKVMTATASAVNYGLGFNIAAVQDDLGWAATLAIPFMFFARTVPQIIKMSTNLLFGPLAILSWIFYCMAVGFVVVLALMIVGRRVR